ncbi:hypothetical protein McpSp1_08150 [Methanocorpusculaceae archaeon Sp1]|nr:hypothetical protein [Methanocorpusculaceae archaeon Sp1]
MQHKASIAVIGIFLLLLFAGTAVAADTGKTVYLDLPTKSITVGESVQIPVIITGVNRLDLVQLTFKTEVAYVNDFIIEKGALDSDEYNIGSGSFRVDGSAVAIWQRDPPDYYSGSGPITFVVLNFTPHTSGNIPLNITVDDIREGDNSDSSTQFSVIDGPILVVDDLNTKTVSLDLPTKSITVGESVQIPVIITGVNRLDLVQLTFKTEVAYVNDFIIEKGALDSDEYNIGSGSFRVDGSAVAIWQRDPPDYYSGSGPVTFVVLNFTPHTSGNIPLNITVDDIREGDNSDSSTKFSVIDGPISVFGPDPDPVSYLNKLSDNTVPPDKLWSAETPARIVYNASTEERNMAPPQITWGGKSTQLNEMLIVDQISDGSTWNTVFRGVPELDAQGNVTIPAATADDAVELNITFEGRRLGDVDGDAQITISDAQMILDAIVWNIDLIPSEELYASVTGDSDITISDSQKILDFVVWNVNEHYC